MMSPERRAEDLYEQLGKRIRNRRREFGLSQEELADRCGLGRTSIVHIELGRQRTPLHVVWTIAGALGIECRELLGAPREHRPTIRSFLQSIASKRVHRADVS